MKNGIINTISCLSVVSILLLVNDVTSFTTTTTTSSVGRTTFIVKQQQQQQKLQRRGKSSSSSSSSSTLVLKSSQVEDRNKLITSKLDAAASSNQDAITSSNSSSSMDYMNSLESSLQKKSESTSSSSSSSSDLPDWFEPLAWRGVILILCALWASNFAAAKLVMSEPGVDSSLYALARFSVAALALAPGAVGAVKKANMDWETVKGGIYCGSWVAFGYLGQTLGLLTTTASKSCVICSMHCVFVAVIAEFWRVSRATAMNVETKYDTMRLLPAALAVLGVAIVELKGAGGAPTIGDALSFAQPIGFGMGYLTLEELMKKKPEAAYPVTTIKLVVVATASMMMFEFSPLFANNGNGITDFSLRIPDFGPILHSPLALGGILYTGLITTAAALWVESIAFAKVPATDASIILTTEPLIAAGVSAIALGETFGVSDYVGASLIIGACALAVLIDNPEKEHEHDNEKEEAIVVSSSEI